MCSIVLELLDDVVHPLDDHLGVLGGEDQARAEPATGRASRNLSYMNLVSMYYLMVLVPHPPQLTPSSFSRFFRMVSRLPRKNIQWCCHDFD